MNLPVTHNPTLAAGERIDSLTSLRFFAAMGVVLYHFFIQDTLPGSTPSPFTRFLLDYCPFVSHAHLMVDFFFSLSGFVLAYVYHGAIVSRRLNIKTFLIKRFARVYPLHLVTLIPFVIIWLLVNRLPFNPSWAKTSTWPGLGEHLLLLQSVIPDSRGFNIPSWSVSAEWLAYLSFPFVAALFFRYLSVSLGLLVSIAWFGVMYYLGTTAGFELTDRTYNFGALRIAAAMPLGISAYRIYRATPATLGVARAAAWGSILVTLSFMILMAMHARTWQIVPLFACLILLCAIAERGGRLRLLGHPALILGGEISFSIYMIHFFFQSFTRGARKSLHISPESYQSDLLLFVAILLVIGMSYLSFRFVETNAREWLVDLLTGRPRRKDTTAIPLPNGPQGR